MVVLEGLEHPILAGPEEVGEDSCNKPVEHCAIDRFRWPDVFHMIAVKIPSTLVISKSVWIILGSTAIGLNRNRFNYKNDIFCPKKPNKNGPGKLAEPKTGRTGLKPTLC